MKKRLAVTVDEELLERIIQNAKSENRNLSNYVECLLYKVLGKGDDVFYSSDNHNDRKTYPKGRA